MTRVAALRSRLHEGAVDGGSSRSAHGLLPSERVDGGRGLSGRRHLRRPGQPTGARSTSGAARLGRVRYDRSLEDGPARPLVGHDPSVLGRRGGGGSPRDRHRPGNRHLDPERSFAAEHAGGPGGVRARAHPRTDPSGHRAGSRAGQEVRGAAENPGARREGGAGPRERRERAFGMISQRMNIKLGAVRSVLRRNRARSAQSPGANVAAPGGLE